MSYTIREIIELGFTSITRRGDVARIEHLGAMRAGEYEDLDNACGGFIWSDTEEGHEFWHLVNNHRIDEAVRDFPQFFGTAELRIQIPPSAPIFRERALSDDVTAAVLVSLGYTTIAQLVLGNQALQGNRCDDNVPLIRVENGFRWSSSPEGSDFWEHINNRRFDEARSMRPELFEGDIDDPAPLDGTEFDVEAVRQRPVLIQDAYLSAEREAINTIAAASGVPASALNEKPEKPKKVKVGNNVYGKVVRTTVRKDVLKQFIETFRKEKGVVSKKKGVTVFKVCDVVVGRFTERKDGRYAGRINDMVLTVLKPNGIAFSLPLTIISTYPELKPHLSSFFEEPSSVQQGITYAA